MGFDDLLGLFAGNRHVVSPVSAVGFARAIARAATIADTANNMPGNVGAIRPTRYARP